MFRHTQYNCEFDIGVYSPVEYNALYKNTQFINSKLVCLLLIRIHNTGLDTETVIDLQVFP